MVLLTAIILLFIGIICRFTKVNRTQDETGSSGSSSKLPDGSLPLPPPSSKTIVPLPSATARITIGPYVRQQALGFTLKTLEGNAVNLGDYLGKVVLLNFWASWCLPCKEEMPVIQTAYGKHIDHGLAVLGINITSLDDRKEVERFIKVTGVTFTILLDEDGSISNQGYRINSIPTSFWIDQSGIIRHFQIGAMSTEQIEQTLKEMSREPSSK